MNAAAVVPGDGDRMLAAVSFVDVVNYTAMVAADEPSTHAEWMAVLGAIIRPGAARHRGNVVKSTGDGVLALFQSVSDAVEWAVEIQQALGARRMQTDGSALRIALRIAVHLSDVTHGPDDIFGDGVNVAARLLEHAAPGCVVLSEAAYDLVRGSAATAAQDIGFRTLKNLERPVRLFQIALDDGAARPTAGVLGSVPSIAVLPLANLGAGETDDYFGDGVVEDVIVSLAGLGELMVVSRASTLGFRERVATPQEVGRALGVRYALLGTMRRTSRLIRVAWQLCHAQDGVAIWSDTMEVAPGELFEMQDQIVAKVVAGVAPSVKASELRRAMRKRPESFTAYDHTLHAMHLLYRFDADSFAQARTRLDLAIAADPAFAMPYAWAAWWHLIAVGQGHAADAGAHIRDSGLFAEKAMELDGGNAQALAIAGHIKSFLFHQYEIGLLYLDRARAISPSSALAWSLSAASLAYVGQGAAAVAHAERSLQLSPLDRLIFFMQSNACLAHYAHGTFDQAVEWGRRCESNNPRFTANYRLLAGSLVATGAIDAARAVGRRLMELEPGFRVGIWAETLQPFRDPEMGRLYKQRLLVAGLPE